MSDRKKRIRDAVLGGNKIPSGMEKGPGGFVISGNIVAGGNVTLIADSSVHISAENTYISEDQAVHIKELVHEVARSERVYAQNPVSIPLVWLKLKEKMRVTSYKLIPNNQYADAVQILQDWKTMALHDSKRPIQSLEERKKTYRQCHRIAKRYGLYHEMRTLLQSKWQTTTMRDLEDTQLQELLAFMQALETQYRQA